MLDAEDRKALSAFFAGIWTVAQVPLTAIGAAVLLGWCVSAFLWAAGWR